MWVFGYGSLLWNPGFRHRESRVGRVHGYARRFWQGNDHHRGTPHKLGRVATLVEDKEGVTWGVAYLLSEEHQSEALAYLQGREGRLGGYVSAEVPFHPLNGDDDPFPALLFLARPDSALYLGPAPPRDLARAICTASGRCGHNAEYLLRLAAWLREHALPDDHVTELEGLVLEGLREQGVDPVRMLEAPSTPHDDFVSRLPTRRLRCVDI